MLNKKFPKLAVLSLLGILTLTACDSSSSEIYAKPSNYNDPIVTIKDHEDEKIHNDILKIIYDAMHDGSVASEVLDKVLAKYAESVFGVYNKVTAKGEEVVTLAEAASVGSTKIDEFVRAHKVYWHYNEDGKHVNDAGQEVNDKVADWPVSGTERSNVTSMWNNIETRIKESLFNSATTSTYNSNHYFNEVEFLKSLYKDGKKVNYKAARDADPALLPFFVDYQIEAEDVFSFGLLHREYYQSENATYIEDEIIPAVYSDLLIEQYLLDEELASVRNSRARKINVIKIEKYSSFTNNADLLVKDLVNAIYADVPADNAHVRTVTSSEDNTVDSIEKHYQELFDKYATVSKGLYDQIDDGLATDNELEAIVKRLQAKGSDIYELVTTGSHPYYNNTAYGDLIKDYDKFLSQDTYEKLDMSLYNKFTASGTITKEEGLDQATIDIDQNKTITKGWFIQSTQPSLDSAGTINDRLFKLSVANDKLEVGGEDDASGSDATEIAANLEQLESLDRFEKTVTGNTWTWAKRAEPSKDENKYVCTINGAYFLKFEGQYSKDDPFNDIVYDDGSAYYIVNILEAVKDNKLRTSGKYSYATLRGTKFLNKVIDEISKKVAETGSYASLSKEYWLEKMNLKYHDQKVYDYFKDNYPDLFD